MRKDKEVALKLRLAGKSYGQISQNLKVSKSTLSLWLSDVLLSKEAQEKIIKRRNERSFAGLLKRNKNQTALAEGRANEARKTAKDAVTNISKDQLFLLGIALYWAEGYKRPVVRNGREITSHGISLTNADPYLIKLFLRFLRESLRVPEEKIKASVRIFQHQNTNEVEKFWQKETGIPPSRFGKIYLGISKSSEGKRPFNRLPYGVIQITVSNTGLFHQIMGSIEGIKKFV